MSVCVQAAFLIMSVCVGSRSDYVCVQAAFLIMSVCRQHF